MSSLELSGAIAEATNDKKNNANGQAYVKNDVVEHDVESHCLNALAISIEALEAITVILDALESLGVLLSNIQKVIIFLSLIRWSHIE